MDIERHVTVVAALQIGLSILCMLIGTFVFVLLTGIGVASQEGEAFLILSTIGTAVSFFFFAISIPGIIAGVGLFKRKEWARILALIISVLDLLNVPIGTALGVYTIWALVQPEAIALFKKEAREKVAKDFQVYNEQ